MLNEEFFQSLTTTSVSVVITLTSAHISIHISDPDDTERRRSFREHRKAHYDEFRKVRENRREGSFLEDDFDEETKSSRKANGTHDISASVTAGVKDIDIEDSSPPATES